MSELSSPAPRVSVVIPTYGRPDRLRECLAALGLSDEAAFEVVVVDDGSVPPVEPVVLEAQDAGLPVRYHRQENQGCGPAKRTGASLARGKVLLFTDDDCRPAPDWIRLMADAVEREPDALVGGAVVNGLEHNIYAAVSQDIASYLVEESAASAEGEVTYFTGNNIGCTRAAFEAVGGFDPRFFGAADDRELGLRWRASGRPLRYLPDAVVAHFHSMTLSGFWRQHVHYGRGARHLRSQETAGDHAFSGPGFYVGLVTYPLRKRRPAAAARMGLSLLSQVATAYGLVTGGARKQS